MDPITRRELLRRGALGAAAVTFPSLLAACGGGGGIEAQTAAQPGTTTTEKKLADQLVIANWPYYIDVAKDKKTRPSLVEFTKRTGVDVRYLEEVGSNEKWFGKYQAQLRQGDDIGRDIVVLTDWMASRMVKLGYVQKKDKSAIPNEKNLAPALKSPGFDPDREFSLPWQSGITGITYNKKLTGRPVTSLDQLLTDPKLKGKVTVLDDIASCMTLVLLANGDDPTKVTPEAFDRGIQTLKEGVDSGQIRRIAGNEYPEDMLAGNVWAGMAWSGDVLNTLQPENRNFEFSVPDDGGEIFTDNMLIPNGGDVFTASTFMNYVYEPAVAAQIETGALYICPVVGAKEEMLKLDPALAKNELVFPSDETLSKVKIFDSEAANEPEFIKKFQALQGH